MTIDLMMSGKQPAVLGYEAFFCAEEMSPDGKAERKNFRFHSVFE